MIPIACWNVRGLNKKDHQQAIRELISSHNLRVCALVETRVVEKNAYFISNYVQSSWNWYFDYVNGPGKRIWVGWDSSYVNVSILGSTDQIVHCKITSHDHNMVLYVSFAYGLNTVGERRGLWDDMLAYSENRVDDAWAVMGDFNAILDYSEALGGSMEEDLNDEFQACLAVRTLLPFQWRVHGTHGTIDKEEMLANGEDWIGWWRTLIGS